MPKEPELVMKLRGGSVLGMKTILKSDHFPGCQNKRLSPQIDGAPNYRQVPSAFSPHRLIRIFRAFAFVVAMNVDATALHACVVWIADCSFVC